MKKIKLFIFTIITFAFATSVEAITIEQKWVQEETPISGDFISYQELISIGNDVVAIGNTGGNLGHNIVRYDTNGNKLWSVETDKYTSFRDNGENIEALYSSPYSGISIIDSYDKNGILTNKFEEILDDRNVLVFAGNKTFLISFERNSNIIKLNEIGENNEIVQEYECYLSDSLIYSDSLSYEYIAKDNILLFSAYVGAEKIDDKYYYKNILFTFDISKRKFSEEFSYLYENNKGILSENGFFITFEGGYYYNNNKFFSETSKIISAINYDNMNTLENYFLLNNSYYNNNYYYISGYDNVGAVLYKLDKDFELVWTYRYESEEEFSTLKNMIKLNDYLFVLYETKVPNGEERHNHVSQDRYNSIVVLDSDGNLVMEYALDSEELKGSEFHNIIESDDGVIIAGEIYSEDRAANAIIAELSIVFNIETKTDGNGTIKASATTEHSGNQVTFEITPKEGYVLGEVKVTDSQGNVVIFTDYTFTMPNADVLIEATFLPIPKEDNPNTVDKISLLIITIFALGLVIIHNNKKRISLN